MKFEVKMTHELTMFVEAESEDQLSDFLDMHTPHEAFILAAKQQNEPVRLNEDFKDEIIRVLDDSQEVDYVIKD